MDRRENKQFFTWISRVLSFLFNDISLGLWFENRLEPQVTSDILHTANHTSPCALAPKARILHENIFKDKKYWLLAKMQDLKDGGPRPRFTSRNSRAQLDIENTWASVHLHAKSLQLCLTLCDPMDYSPPGSSVHRILLARILGWVAMPSFRGSSRPRDRTHVSYVYCIGRGFFTTSTIWEAHYIPINVLLNTHNFFRTNFLQIRITELVTRKTNICQVPDMNHRTI